MLYSGGEGMTSTEIVAPVADLRYATLSLPSLSLCNFNITPHRWTSGLRPVTY